MEYEPHEKKTPAAEETTGAVDSTSKSNNTVHGNNEKCKRIVGDTNAAIEFLQQWAQGGPWQLHAMDPNRKAKPITAYLTDEKTCRAFIDKYNGERNLYWTVNRVKPGEHRRKEDITALVGLHIDLDPPKEEGRDLEVDRAEILGLLTENLPEGIPKPSFIIDSGGGYWGLWPFKSPKETGADVEGLPPEEVLKTITEQERWNIGIEEAFGKPYADNCFNIDRICRLPGTVNIPDKKKRDAGRTEALATLEYVDERKHSANDFPKGEPRNIGKATANEANEPASTIADAETLSGLDELPPSVPYKIRETIRKGGVGAGYPSESEGYFAVACALARAGVKPETILGILLDPKFPISKRLREKGEKYALKQVIKALEYAADFTTDDNGKPHKSIGNCRRALNKMGVRIVYDELAGRYRIYGLKGHGPFLDDHSERELRLTIRERFGINYGRADFNDFIMRDGYRDRFHPVREYIGGLKWDGIPRVEQWLIDCAGAEDTDYTRAVSKLPLIAAVRRIRRPGAKFDELLVLEGEQGGLKSTALKMLAVNDEWFSDNLPLTGDSKIAIEQTRGKWVVEAGELKGSDREVDKLKNFLSMTTDSARLAYARHSEDVPRHWIAIGTTNKGQYLHDPTGNRRFWPVKVDRFNLEKFTPEYVDQMWAEAAALEAQGESIRLDPLLYHAAAIEQEKRVEDDPWLEDIAEVVGPSGDCKISSKSIWMQLGLSDKRDQTRDAQRRIAGIMRTLGFKAQTIRIDGLAVRGYKRGEPKEATMAHGEPDPTF